MEGRLDTFKQVLSGPVWDGDIASKAQRDLLKEAGFVDSGYGFNFITAKGVEAAVALGLLVRGAQSSQSTLRAPHNILVGASYADAGD